MIPSREGCCALQMNGMAMNMQPNGMMHQQAVHGHMLGQQAQAPGLAGMMPPQNGSQPVRKAVEQFWHTACPFSLQS